MAQEAKLTVGGSDGGAHDCKTEADGIEALVDMIFEVPTGMDLAFINHQGDGPYTTLDRADGAIDAKFYYQDGSVADLDVQGHCNGSILRSALDASHAITEQPVVLYTNGKLGCPGTKLRAEGKVQPYEL